MNNVNGMVVCPEPRAAEIGADILRAGGNAFDAAVAAGFAQMVYSPFMCGLGGWGMATLYDAGSQTTEHVGFPAKVGSKMHPEMWADDIMGYTDMWHVGIVRDHVNLMGYTAIMTPGVVAGLGEIHRRHGSLPWSELIAPSVAASEEGFPFPEEVALVTRSFVLPGMPSIEEHYCWSPDAKELFIGPDGRLKRTGEHYRNSDQARSLQQIADRGPEDFYTGDLAGVIVEDFERNGAFVTAEDLSEYKPEIGAPLSTSYRGFRAESSPPPNGGLLTLHILRVLERFDLGRLEHNGPEHAFIMGAAMAWAGVVRFRYLGDPKYADVPVEHVLSDEYCDEVADNIRRGQLPDVDVLDEPRGTTHLVVSDRVGNCVSMTQTLTLSSGVIIPGTGFPWNGCASLMDPEPGRPNSLVPGRSRANAASPTILFKDGEPRLILGAPGGYSVSSAVTQALVNMIDFGMSPLEAVSVPRLHSEGTILFAEGRFPLRTIEELKRRGFPVEHRAQNYDSLFGRVQLIELEGGVARGASDPRKDGGAPMSG
ncbi:gamma-glutamyltransferase family protein [Nocardioides sp. LHD-245]|uniref:gamma-glutamyltransferase family protein n=1 Tax=Nocardioides sp. LHD-245 TaxID=3051387 RepID=UPI0027DFADC2|nr:gamma-glutamyltransferase family protein [Nocardioides sp. LHD-245]